MSFRSLVLAWVSLGSLAAADNRLVNVHQVYILQMSGGLDQYLASRLARSGRFTVVTDPARADALLTDQIGSVFEERFQSLYPPPPPPEEVKKAESDKDKPAPAEEKSMVAMLGSAPSGSRPSSFSRGRGNVFLVDRDTRQVVWSTYLRPRTTRPDEMDRTADKIVDRIEEALSHQQKETKNAPGVNEYQVPPPAAPPITPGPEPAPASAAAPPADAAKRATSK